MDGLSSVGCDLHNLYIKLVVFSIISPIMNMHKIMQKVEIRWFKVLRGHPRSSVTKPFDGEHTTSYSNLIETMRLSRTVFEILSLIFQQELIKR